MSVQQTYTCDVCGKQKGEGNGWWIAQRAGSGIAFYHWTEALLGQALAHLCGAQCVHDFLSKWLEK